MITVLFHTMKVKSDKRYENWLQKWRIVCNVSNLLKPYNRSVWGKDWNALVNDNLLLCCRAHISLVFTYSILKYHIKTCHTRFNISMQNMCLETRCNAPNLNMLIFIIAQRENCAWGKLKGRFKVKTDQISVFSSHKAFFIPHTKLFCHFFLAWQPNSENILSIIPLVFGGDKSFRFWNNMWV